MRPFLAPRFPVAVLPSAPEPQPHRPRQLPLPCCLPPLAFLKPLWAAPPLPAGRCTAPLLLGPLLTRPWLSHCSGTVSLAFPLTRRAGTEPMLVQPFPTCLCVETGTLGPSEPRHPGRGLRIFFHLWPPGQ